MNKGVPCLKDCPRRSSTCHAECPDYLEWELIHSLTRDLINAEKHKKREAETILIEQNIKARRKRNIDESK